MYLIDAESYNERKREKGEKTMIHQVRFKCLFLSAERSLRLRCPRKNAQISATIDFLNGGNMA